MRDVPGAVGIVGCGLLGGSLGRALKALATPPRTVVIDPDVAVGTRAVSDGVADEWYQAPCAALRACDVVVLCAPIAAIEQALAPVSSAMRDGAVLTDVAGSKGAVADAARAGVRRRVHFVGAHPMFGGESGGYAASRADLWRSGVVALCTDGADAEALERVAALHLALGAEIVRCTAAEHDAAMAVVSHLPYVVANAFEHIAASDLSRSLAGRGFADLTRLARFDFAIQGEVARRNPYLRSAAKLLREELDVLLDALEAPDDQAQERFASHRAKRPRT